MLSEKIIYDNHLPIKVTTVTLKDYPMHFHKDIEVAYVLDGKISVRNGCCEQELYTGGVFVFNSLELHSMSARSEENMVMMLHLDGNYFDKYYPTLKDAFFAVDSDNASDSVDVLKTHMASIMMEMLQKGYKYEEKVIESVHNLINCLLSEFVYTISENHETGDKTRTRNAKTLAARLHRVMKYMCENYDRKLTLNEIADRENLSLYYLSHVIKDATDMSYQDLLNYVRVEASEKLVLNTSKRMGAIAEEVGFSAVRYYIKHFETWYKMHPLEYRKKYTGKIVRHRVNADYVRSAPVEIEEAIRRHRKEVYADYIDRFKTKPVIIDINASTIPKEKLSNSTGLTRLMSRPVNRILAEPYLRFRDMDENIVAQGDNYIVTTKCDGTGLVDSLSIIVYNIDDSMAESLAVVETEQELLNAVSAYETEMEFLFRFHGYNGNFRVLRYKSEKGGLIRKISDSVNIKGVLDARDRFINELSAEPSVYAGEYKSTENISLRSAFSGIGLEMILIDKIGD